MRLSDIRSRLENLPDVAEALTTIENRLPCDLHARNAVKPILLAALAARLDRPLILVVPDEARASEMVQDIQAWVSSADVLSMPDPDQPAYSQMAVNQNILNQRVGVLSRLATADTRKGNTGKLVVVASIPALLRRLVPRKNSADNFSP